MKHRNAVREHAVRLSTAAEAPGVVMASVLAALIFGLALPGSPWDAVAVLVLLPLGLAAPTAAVVAILAVTVLVPWDVQNQLQILGGGEGQRGVLFIDALLFLALLRTGWLLIRRRIEFDLPMLLGTVVAAVLSAATLWGLVSGADVSEAAVEGRRVLFAAGTFLLAWPLLRDGRRRRILIRWLFAIFLALGIWGLAQWLFDVGYSTAGDVGVRGGLSSGQLQGGMYAYPVAVVLAWSALISGSVKDRATRTFLATVLALNAVCVFLTFERTLIVSTALACGFVVAIGGAEVRRHALRWSAVLTVLLLIGAVIGETQARTAFERMALVGNLESDNSYTHRMIEAEVMQEEITARPVFGSGFGATVTWGVEDKFATDTTTFADLGFHWLAWKVGLPAAALIALILFRAVFRRSRGSDDDHWQAMRLGARGALLALLVTAVLFGVFNALGITAVIGLLVALCYSHPTQPDGSDAPNQPAAPDENPQESSDLDNLRKEIAR